MSWKPHRLDIEKYAFHERREIFASCLNKRYYHTHELAEDVAKRRVAEQPGLVLGVYKCKFCEKWHLSSRVEEYNLRAIGSKTVIDA